MLCVQQPHRQRGNVFVPGVSNFLLGIVMMKTVTWSPFSPLCVLSFVSSSNTRQEKLLQNKKPTRTTDCMPIYERIIWKPCMNISSVFDNKKREQRAKTKREELLTVTGSCLSPWAVITWRQEESSQWLPTQLECSSPKVGSTGNTFIRHIWFQIGNNTKFIS